MKHPELDPAQEREYLLQQHAEAAEHGDGDLADGSVQRYRFVYQMLHETTSEPPADFAAAMEQLTRDHEECARVETWLLRAIVLAPLILAATGSRFLPGLGPAFTRTLASLPWHALAAAGLSLGLAWALDLAFRSRRGRPTGR